MRTRLLLASLVGVAAVAACTSTSAGTPQPAPADITVESSASSSPPDATGPGENELPYAGAPAVEEPMGTKRFQQDPCQSLTADQAGELNVQVPGELRDAALGNACEFRGRSDRRAVVEVASLDKNPIGVSAVYQADKDGELAFIVPMDPIDGFPLVAYGVDDQRDHGACALVFGTSDEIAFQIDLQVSTDNIGKLEPCETAAMVAGMVLQTMKAS